MNWRRLLKVAVVLAALAGLWFFWPRHADMRGFDPAVSATLEARMWRSYYAHQRVTLFADLYRLSRGQYHFSPWDSTRLGWHAARSARVFQASRSRAEAQAALPMLERYYGVIRAGSGENFDAPKAAREELEWWQLRRENTKWPDYGQAIARVTETVYRVRGPAVDQSALLRAEMMDYRDARRRRALSEEEWKHVEAGLLRAWTLLKEAVR